MNRGAAGAEIVTVEGFVQAVELVNSGRADLTLNDFVSFQQFFKKTPNAKIELLKGDVEANIQICALFNKGNADFKAELDKVLGKRLAHAPWDRECDLASVTSLVYRDREIVDIFYSSPAQDI